MADTSLLTRHSYNETSRFVNFTQSRQLKVSRRHLMVSNKSSSGCHFSHQVAMYRIWQYYYRKSLCTFHTGLILSVRFGYFSILSKNIPNLFHFHPRQIHKASCGRSSPGRWIVPVPGRGRVPPSAPPPWSGTAAGGSPAPPGSQTETCRRRTWQVSCLQLDKDSRLSVRLADVADGFPPSALCYYRAAPGLIVSNVPTIVKGKESVEVIMVPVRTHNEPEVSAGSLC